MDGNKFTSFEKKVLLKLYSPVNVVITGERRRKEYYEVVRMLPKEEDYDGLTTLEKLKSAATYSDRTESCREITFRKNKGVS